MKRKDNSKVLLKKIKTLMRVKKMRWRDASDYFGFESPSTIYNWFTNERIPLNWQTMLEVILDTKGEKKK